MIPTWQREGGRPGAPYAAPVAVRGAGIRFAAFVARRGSFYRLARPLLRLAAACWRAGAALDRLTARPRRLPRPVISIGNITLGGTGKTPLVIALARRLAAEGRRVGILTRGYRARAGGDEPALLAQALPAAQIIVSPDRHAAALRALEGERPPDVFLLDDGLQHWRLARDLNIVVLDALAPFGLGDVVPAGLLREGLGALGRVGAAVITRADLVRPQKLALIAEYLAVRFPRLACAFMRERVRAWRRLGGDAAAEPPQGSVYAVCGIGNPVNFVKRLAAEGIACAGALALPDHHAWRRSDVGEVEAAAGRAGAAAIVTTAKDASKIDAAAPSLPWFVLDIESEFLAGETAVLDLVRAAIRRGAPASHGPRA